jgi:ABC-type transporter Mla subunit MlaD
MSSLLSVGTREVVWLTTCARRGVEDALALPRRALSLMTSADALIDRVHEVLDSIELTRADADALLSRAEQTRTAVADMAARAEATRRGAAETVAAIDELVGQVGALLERFRPSLTRLAPRLDADVVPLLDGLGTIAPDVHQLLAIVGEFDEVLGHVPGMGRIKRRVEIEMDALAKQNGSTG